MAAFRFRAQPALDLRRREHEAAQRAVARADIERQRAASRLEAAERALADAVHAADACDRAGESRHQLEWYRFWIVKLEQERDAHRAALAACEDALAKAREACRAAQQRRDALERFRDKAYAAFRAAEAEAERKAIDELAARRFTAARRADQGA